MSVNRYSPSASVTTFVNESLALINPLLRRPTVTPRAGLSLIVTRPEIEPRGDLTTGSLVTDWANKGAAKQSNSNKMGSALRVEVLIQSLLGDCGPVHHTAATCSLKELQGLLPAILLVVIVKILLLGSRAHGSSENHRRQWPAMAV